MSLKPQQHKSEIEILKHIGDVDTASGLFFNLSFSNHHNISERKMS